MKETKNRTITIPSLSALSIINDDTPNEHYKNSLKPCCVSKALTAALGAWQVQGAWMSCPKHKLRGQRWVKKPDDVTSKQQCLFLHNPVIPKEQQAGSKPMLRWEGWGREHPPPNAMGLRLGHWHKTVIYAKTYWTISGLRKYSWSHHLIPVCFGPLC